MSLRTKMLFVFIFMSTLPLVIFWGAQQQIYQGNIEKYESFTHDIFLDWRDGEIENVAHNTSLRMRQNVEQMKDFTAYQTGLAQEFLSKGESLNKVWPFMGEMKKISLLLPYSHHILMFSGDYYKYEEQAEKLTVRNPFDVDWYQAAMNADETVFEIKSTLEESANISIVMAEKIIGEDDKVLGVSAVYFKLPNIFQRNLERSFSTYDSRNSQMEGFLLDFTDRQNVSMVASQRRDYASPLLYWDLPLLEKVFFSESLLLDRVMTEVIEDNNILQKKIVFDGQEFLWSFGPIDGQKLVFALLTPLDGIMAQVRIVEEMGTNVLSSHKNKMLFALACAFALAIVSAMFCSAALIRRIRNMIESLERVEEGQPFVFDHENAHDEISDLSHKVEYVLRNNQIASSKMQILHKEEAP